MHRGFPMNDAALKYKIYKILLESDVSKNQRDLMVELGIVDTIKSMFKGAGKTAGKAAAILKDEFAQEKLGAAQKNLKSAIDDLRDIAKKAGKDDAFVNALLQQLMQNSGADPQAVAAASPEAAAGESGGKGSGKTAAAPAAGATITTQAITQNPNLATALIAAATDKKPAEVAPKVEEKKPDATAVTKLVARAASKATGVKDDLAGKVIQTLFDAGRLKLESRKEKSDVITEQFGRWQQLAKLPQGLLVEGQKEDKWIAMVDKGDFKTEDELQKAFEEKMGKAPGFPRLGDQGKQRVIAKLKEKSGAGSGKQGADAGKQDTDTAKEESGKGAPSELSKIVRSKIKPEELSDDDLNKVVNWVDEFLDKVADAAATSEKEAK